MPWVRRMVRDGKVWVEVDDAGRLVEVRGVVQMRYREDDDRTYSVRADQVEEVDEERLERAKAERKAARAERRKRDRAAPSVLDIHVDVASFSSPGPAGVGIVLAWGETTKEVARHLSDTNRARAELWAVREALTLVQRPTVRTRLATASGFVLGVLNQGREAGSNVDLVDEIEALRDRFDDLECLRSTAGAAAERASQLARDALRAAP